MCLRVMDVSVWTDPLWLAEAHDWIYERVVRLDLGAVGVIDQHHVRPWSTVMRVPTESGPRDQLGARLHDRRRARRHQPFLHTTQARRLQRPLPTRLPIRRTRPARAAQQT